MNMAKVCAAPNRIGKLNINGSLQTLKVVNVRFSAFKDNGVEGQVFCGLENFINKSRNLSFLRRLIQQFG